MEQTALPDTGIPHDGHKLPLTATRALDAELQEVEFLSPPDVATEASLLRDLEARLDIGLSHDAIRNGGVGLALECNFGEHFRIEIGADQASCFSANQNIVGLRCRFQSHPGDHSFAGDAIETIARVAKVRHDETRMDSGMHPERLSDAVFHVRTELPDKFMQFKCSSHRAKRVIFVRL